MEWLKNLATRIVANNISRAFLGWGSWFASSWVYDDLLYPIVIAWLGPLMGGSIMTTIAALICWFWLKGILGSDKEWFGMDVMKKLQRIVPFSLRLVAWIPFFKTRMDKVEWLVTFLALSIKFDPMITTLYFKYGDQSKTLTKTEKKIFFWSVLVCNTYWTLRNWGLVVVLKFLWDFFQLLVLILRTVY